MEEITSLEPSKKGFPGRNAPGGPPGNQKAFKHGVRAMELKRKLGKIDKRTSFGQAFEKRKRLYISDLGGNQLSVMELTLIEDTVWTDFYVAAYDAYLSRLKNVIRKGRPHPIIEARTRVAAHRRDNLRTLGLKRVVKTLSIQEYLAKEDKPATDPSTELRAGNGNADEGSSDQTKCSSDQTK